MRNPNSRAAIAASFVALLWSCPPALGELPAKYELPRWCGQGSLVVVVDVSDVQSGFYEMAGRAEEIVRLVKRAKASCLIVEDADLPWRREPRTRQPAYQPATTYLRLANHLGVRRGVVLPSVGVDPSAKQQSEWITRVVELVDRDDYDYIALPDQASVAAFLSAPKDELYRRELRDDERTNWWSTSAGNRRSEWRVLRLPESASTEPSLAATVVEATKAPWLEAQPPNRYGRRWPKEFEVTLENGDGASRQFVDQLIDAASDSRNTRIRLRLTLQADGSLDDQAFATLQEVAEWMEAYGSPWDHRHIGPPPYIANDATEGLRVICGHGTLWVIGDAWPKDGIHLPALYADNAHEVVSVRLVGTQKMLMWQQGDHEIGLTIQPPRHKPRNLPWVVEIGYIDTTP
ncbi:hypothetical protein [Aeoliella sp.]|uniref:hypothetical protein n=1 Tax=Aeoliella sp. TaxID=2795800 RepID=UPI003CCC293A